MGSTSNRIGVVLIAAGSEAPAHRRGPWERKLGSTPAQSWREAVNGAARARRCGEETPTRHDTLIFPAARAVAPWPSG